MPLFDMDFLRVWSVVGIDEAVVLLLLNKVLNKVVLNPFLGSVAVAPPVLLDCFMLAFGASQ